MSALNVQAVHCTNCGAPAVPLRAPGAAFCTYCGAYQAAYATSTPDDGIVLRCPTAAEHCPLCAAHLDPVLVADLPAWRCAACRGLLAEMEAFAQIVRHRRAEFTGAESPPAPFNPDELKRVVHCPRCRSLMETHPYSGPGNVVIDVCIGCELVWLDQGELTALERAPGKR